MNNKKISQLAAKETLVKSLNGQQIELVAQWLREKAKVCTEDAESEALFFLSDELVATAQEAVYEPSTSCMLEAIHQIAGSLDRLHEHRTATKLRMVGNCISHRLNRRASKQKMT